MELEVEELAIIRFLKTFPSDTWKTPTEIATEVQAPNWHIAWAIPVCMRLKDKGVLERNLEGSYRLISSWRKTIGSEYVNRVVYGEDFRKTT